MAETDFQSLRKALLERLGEDLRRDGFTGADGQTFRCPQDFGDWAFHVAFIPHKGDFDITADVAIRVDAVEELTAADNSLTAAQNRRTSTVGVELGNLADGRQRRWTVSSLPDVEPVAVSVLKAFREFGLPYLKRYSNLEQLLALLSSGDRAAWLHAPVHDSRCKSAVALALVLGRRADAMSISDQCRHFLEQRKDPGLPSFTQFVGRVLKS